jgi:quinolinate synthase
LPKILYSLQTLAPTVEVDPQIADRARLSMDRMLAVGRKPGTN